MKRYILKYNNEERNKYYNTDRIKTILNIVCFSHYKDYDIEITNKEYQEKYLEDLYFEENEEKKERNEFIFSFMELIEKDNLICFLCYFDELLLSLLADKIWTFIKETDNNNSKYKDVEAKLLFDNELYIEFRLFMSSNEAISIEIKNINSYVYKNIDNFLK